MEAGGRPMWNIGNEKSKFRTEVQNVECSLKNNCTSSAHPPKLYSEKNTSHGISGQWSPHSFSSTFWSHQHAKCAARNTYCSFHNEATGNDFFPANEAALMDNNEEIFLLYIQTIQVHLPIRVFWGPVFTQCVMLDCFIIWLSGQITLAPREHKWTWKCT